MKGLILVLLALWTCEAEPYGRRQDPAPTGTQFQRPCKYDGDCDFTNQGVGTVFLPCVNKVCVCKNPASPMMDTAFYPVKLVAGTCTVGAEAPCGTSNGLTLTCQPGIPCVENRCRKEIRNRPLNYYCDEDIDCQEGLVCRSNRGFPPSKYCNKP